MTSRILLDTREHADAILCGYDGPVDPNESDEGLIVEYHPPNYGAPACVEITTGQSSIDLCGPEIGQVGKVLAIASQLAALRSAQCQTSNKPKSTT